MGLTDLPTACQEPPCPVIVTPGEPYGRDHYRTNITSTVEENITNAMSVDQLAKLSGRSLSSFRRDFIAIYNMPPKRWIRLKRIEKAKQLLRARP